jgi:hypothetical protein
METVLMSTRDEDTGTQWRTPLARTIVQAGAKIDFLRRAK